MLLINYLFLVAVFYLQIKSVKLQEITAKSILAKKFKNFNNENCTNKICLNICDEVDLGQPILLNTSLFSETWEPKIVDLQQKHEKYGFVLNKPCDNALLLAPEVDNSEEWKFFEVN